MTDNEHGRWRRYRMDFLRCILNEQNSEKMIGKKMRIYLFRNRLWLWHIKNIVRLIYRFLARHRWHKWRYCLHWIYMKTTPPVSPTVTTTNFVQNGHPMRPRFTSSAARSMSTHSDQMTHSAAAKWNKTAQKSRRRSTPDISRLLHWNMCPKERREKWHSNDMIAWHFNFHFHNSHSGRDLPHWRAWFLYAL